MFVCVVVIVGGIFFLQTHKNRSITSYDDMTPERTLIDTVSYICDEGKTITATYYDGPTMPTPAPGEPPVPTGSVDVVLDTSPTTTLMQTLSASGIRYANEDESLVFWSKGNEALVMRHNAMDLTYTNCTAQTN